MPATEPRSALELQRSIDALAARRANPSGGDDAEGPFVVSFQYPEGGSPWHAFDGAWGSLDSAIDEASYPGTPLPAATVVRVAGRDGRAVWLGVADGSGQVHPAPKAPGNAPPRAPGLPADWLDAWDGPTARTSWMLRQGGYVDRKILTAAACACARTAVEFLSGDRGCEEVLAVVERWTRGEATNDDLDRASAIARGCYGGDYTDRSARAAMTVARVAQVAVAGDARIAGHIAGFVADQAAQVRVGLDAPPGRVYAEMRRMAPVVRAALPLGLVLLSRLPTKRPKPRGLRAKASTSRRGGARSGGTR